ncbi:MULTISPECIES: hypothetical protein [Dickeya]|uniref:hypothetical protein n=1 Tax=Dickeya TaxID=204037 RepID=UPI001CE5B90D|nr:hypothetical protein FGI04_02570 [Dickeya zeae]
MQLSVLASVRDGWVNLQIRQNKSLLLRCGCGGTIGYRRTIGYPGSMDVIGYRSLSGVVLVQGMMFCSERRNACTHKTRRIVVDFWAEWPVSVTLYLVLIDCCAMLESKNFIFDVHSYLAHRLMGFLFSDNNGKYY